MPPPDGASPRRSTTLTPPASAFLSPALAIPPAALLAVGLGILAVAAIGSVAAQLWSVWATDSLETLGAVIPLVSLGLILRVWRSLGWTLRGSWWGLALLAATVVSVHLRDDMLLALTAGPRVLSLPPLCVFAVLFATGVLLLFGGALLLRRALFPVLLLLLVEPMPGLLGRVLDLRLFSLLAAVVRGLAHALGRQLTPDFARFLAPGHTKLPAALALALVALVFGYLYRLRGVSWALVTLGAFVLGIVLNLIRLCVLVALQTPSLQHFAVAVNARLTAALLFGGTLGLLAVIRRLSPKTPLPAAVSVDPTPRSPSFTARCLALALLTVLGSLTYARGFGRQPPKPVPPAQVGRFTLTRQWEETLPNGETAFHWAEYVPAGGETLITVGVSGGISLEEALRAAAQPSPRQAVSIAGAQFQASESDDDVTQSLELSTICAAATCTERAAMHGHLLYSAPDPRTLLRQRPAHPYLVIVRAETFAGVPPTKELRPVLTEFLQSTPLTGLVAPYGP